MTNADQKPLSKHLEAPYTQAFHDDHPNGMRLWSPNQSVMSVESCRSVRFGMLLQPDSRPISQEQLAAEVKSIYSGFTMVETKCIDVDKAQAWATKCIHVNAAQCRVSDHVFTKLKVLLQEHHDFFFASQHPLLHHPSHTRARASTSLAFATSNVEQQARFQWWVDVIPLLQTFAHTTYGTDCIQGCCAWKYVVYSSSASILFRSITSLNQPQYKLVLRMRDRLHMPSCLDPSAYHMRDIVHEIVSAGRNTHVHLVDESTCYRMAIEDEGLPSGGNKVRRSKVLKKHSTEQTSRERLGCGHTDLHHVSCLSVDAVVCTCMPSPALEHKFRNYATNSRLRTMKRQQIEQFGIQDSQQIAHDHGQALIALHKTLLHEHHDFFLASRHPSSAMKHNSDTRGCCFPRQMWESAVYGLRWSNLRLFFGAASHLGLISTFWSKPGVYGQPMLKAFNPADSLTAFRLSFALCFAFKVFPSRCKFRTPKYQLQQAGVLFMKGLSRHATMLCFLMNSSFSHTLTSLWLTFLLLTPSVHAERIRQGLDATTVSSGSSENFQDQSRLDVAMSIVATLVCVAGVCFGRHARAKFVRDLSGWSMLMLGLFFLAIRLDGQFPGVVERSILKFFLTTAIIYLWTHYSPGGPGTVMLALGTLCTVGFSVVGTQLLRQASGGFMTSFPPSLALSFLLAQHFVETVAFAVPQQRLSSARQRVNDQEMLLTSGSTSSSAHGSRIPIDGDSNGGSDRRIRASVGLSNDPQNETPSTTEPGDEQQVIEQASARAPATNERVFDQRPQRQGQQMHIGG